MILFFFFLKRRSRPTYYVIYSPCPLTYPFFLHPEVSQSHWLPFWLWVSLLASWVLRRHTHYLASHALSPSSSFLTAIWLMAVRAYRFAALSVSPKTRKFREQYWSIPWSTVVTRTAGTFLGMVRGSVCRVAYLLGLFYLNTLNALG